MSTIKMKDQTDKKNAYPNSSVERLRKVTGLSQTEFAALCNIKINSYKTLIKRQDGNGGGLSAENAYRIAAVTGVSPKRLLQNQLRPNGESGKFTKHDYRNYQSSFNFASQVWRNDIVNIIQTRFEETIDLLVDREGLGFLSTLFFLGTELDKINAAIGLQRDDKGKKMEPTVNELVRAMADQVPEATDQLFGDRWRKWKVEEFSESMKEAEKEAKAFLKLNPKKRKVKKTRKPKKLKNAQEA